MAIDVWGLLPKSQEDPETIEEAITRIVTQHEESPTSHLGTGEAISVHREQEMIDHKAGSVAVDKFANAKVIVTCFESLDGWSQYVTGTGAVTHNIGNATISTGATNNSFAEIDVVPDYWLGLNVAKAFFWRATLAYSHDVTLTSYFGIGNIIDEADFNGFGFRWNNGSLVAWMGDYTNFATISIPDIDPLTFHTYEIRYNPDPLLVEFYIDRVLVGSFSTGNFPETTDPYASFTIRNNTGATRRLYITDFMYQQEV